MAACCTTTSILMQISGTHFAYFPFETFYFSSKDFQIRLNLRCLACLLSRVELKNFITKASLK